MELPDAVKKSFATRINVDFLESIGFPISALLEMISLCEYGAHKHGSNSWKEKPPSYHRRHWREHDDCGIEPEDDSLRPNIVHCALREAMRCEATLFQYGPKHIIAQHIEQHSPRSTIEELEME